MTVTERDLTERQRRQQHVAALLDELESTRQRIYRLKAGGASGAGVRDQKRDLAETQRRLLAAVDGAAPGRPGHGGPV